MLYQPGPPENLLLTHVKSLAGILGDQALERLATELPTVAMEIAGAHTIVRVSLVYTALEDRYGPTGMPKLRRAVNYVRDFTRRPYLPAGSPTPLALPWLHTGQGRKGAPYSLMRATDAEAERLRQCEIDHRAAEKLEIEARYSRPLPKLGPPPIRGITPAEIAAWRNPFDEDF
jgi:hypothetical protein